VGLQREVVQAQVVGLLLELVPLPQVALQREVVHLLQVGLRLEVVHLLQVGVIRISVLDIKCSNAFLYNFWFDVAVLRNHIGCIRFHILGIVYSVQVLTMRCQTHREQ
jgi:hypothetical protein